MPLLERVGMLYGKWWYTFMSRISLQVDLYMTQKDEVFIANVVVIGLTQETMALNVINQLASATVELNIIIKIRKYKGLHQGHHFILMAMECIAHPSVIWIVSSRNVLVFSIIDD
jgi:hypothetical protein